MVIFNEITLQAAPPHPHSPLDRQVLCRSELSRSIHDAPISAGVEEDPADVDPKVASHGSGHQRGGAIRVAAEVQLGPGVR